MNIQRIQTTIGMMQRDGLSKDDATGVKVGVDIVSLSRIERACCSEISWQRFVTHEK